MDKSFVLPELLLHPNIPKPLHGVNPRSILGKQWWDMMRRKVYALYDYHCRACGVHKTNAKYHQWLEAHEVYDINYSTGKVKLKNIVALCHSCHNYIHNERMLNLLKQSQFSEEKYLDILAHGESIISQYLTEVAINYQGKPWKIPFEESLPFTNTFPEIIIPNFPEYNPHFASWDQWHLEINGNQYYSRFNDYEEWQSYYYWINENSLKDNAENLALFKTSTI